MRSGTLSQRSFALAVAAAVVIADQLTKWWIVAEVANDPITLIDDFLVIRYVGNPGAAFGLLPGAGSLLALAAVVAVVLIVLVVHQLDHRPEALGMGLVMGGALGNLIDRVFRGDGWLDGEVVDWVDFSFFPAFNVADSAITIGAILVVLVSLRRP